MDSFILDLGKSLLITGTPTHRFEDTMSMVVKRLGISAQFFTLPTGFLSYIGPLGAQQTYYVRGHSGAADLGKISDLHTIVDGVLHGHLEVPEASRQIKELIHAKPRHPAFLRLAAYAGSSGAFAIFFGGGWREGLLAMIPGCMTGILALVLAHKPAHQRVIPVIGATVTGLLAIVLCHLVPHANVSPVTLGGISVLIPGLGIIIALNEVATGNLLTGGTRLMATGVVLLQIAFGFLIAKQVGYHWVQMSPNIQAHVLPTAVKLIVLIFVAPAYLVLFNAKWRDLGAILAGCALAYLGAMVSSAWFGPVFGAGVGAYVLGLGCTFFARWKNRPAFVPLLPGMLMLVPGSLGLRSLAFLAERQITNGIETAIQVSLVAVALLVGLLLSHVTLDSQKTL